MQDTALVALFTGTSSALAVALGAGWQILGESLRARHEQRRRLDAQDEARLRRLRRGLAKARAAAIHLGVIAHVCADARASQHNENDALDQARTAYYEANVRIEALRTLVSDRDDALEAIEGLLTVVRGAYASIRAQNATSAAPQEVEDLIRQELRKVSEAICATRGTTPARRPH